MTDKRIIKTERDIKQAFLRLLKTTSFRKVSINEICDQALISRSTFYAHFQDKYDLLGQLVTQYTTLYRELIEKRAKQIINHESQVLSISEIVSTLQTHREALNILLSIHEEQLDLLTNWQNCLTETWFRVNRSYGADKQAPDDFVASLESAIILNYINWSLQNGINTAASTLNERVVRSIYENTKLSSSKNDGFSKQ